MKISLSNISLSLDSKLIFDSISYEFEAGGFYLIKGESGCGKTTLLRSIATLREVDKGSVNYDFEGSILQLRRKIQYLPQLPVIFEGTVKENILKPFSFKPFLEQGPDENKIKDLLKDLFSDNIDLNKDAKKMSQGEKQRLALCRTLLVEPEVLLCDEPTASLDVKSRKIVEEKIAEFSRHSGKTVIYISHHEDFNVDCDVKMLNMRNGKLEVKA